MPTQPATLASVSGGGGTQPVISGQQAAAAGSDLLTLGGGVMSQIEQAILSQGSDNAYGSLGSLSNPLASTGLTDQALTAGANAAPGGGASGSLDASTAPQQRGRGEGRDVRGGATGGSIEQAAPTQRSRRDKKSRGGDALQRPGKSSGKQSKVDVGNANTGKWVSGDTKGLNKEFLSRLAALGEQLGEPLSVTSGKRSRGEQKTLYKAYKAGTGNLAAKPGSSNHESGDAADVEVNGRSLADVPKAAALAKKLGLGFPVDGEPWHVEIV